MHCNESQNNSLIDDMILIDTIAADSSDESFGFFRHNTVVITFHSSWSKWAPNSLKDRKKASATWFVVEN